MSERRWARARLEAGDLSSWRACLLHILLGIIFGDLVCESEVRSLERSQVKFDQLHRRLAESRRPTKPSLLGHARVDLHCLNPDRQGLHETSGRHPAQQ